ncbi:MAG: hypothetical protein MJZ30_11470 [Paludibacteraceae bacterium]|nr:hypothetical protein [Paludibacteraceae bacterium]
MATEIKYLSATPDGHKLGRAIQRLDAICKELDNIDEEVSAIEGVDTKHPSYDFPSLVTEIREISFLLERAMINFHEPKRYINGILAD